MRWVRITNGMTTPRTVRVASYRRDSARPAPPRHAELRPSHTDPAGRRKRMAKRADGAEWFTLADEARDTDVSAVSRAALAVLRNRLDSFDIDAQSDAPWPAAVQGAVALLDARRTGSKRTLLFGLLRRAPGITARLDLAKDDDYQAALAVAPYTIGCTGLARGRILYAVNDTGTSAAFRLTSAEADEVRIHTRSLGGDPRALVPMTDRHN